jgi:hypothetical protein
VCLGRGSLGDRLLAETKQRQRLLQDARTSERLEQLEIEACEELGRQLRLEYLELNGLYFSTRITKHILSIYTFYHPRPEGYRVFNSYYYKSDVKSLHLDSKDTATKVDKKYIRKYHSHW